MKFPAVAALSLSFLLSACATTYPLSREDQAAYHADAARELISKGDNANAAIQIAAALTRPTGDAKIKELFASDPKGRDSYRAYLEKTVTDVSSADSATSALNKLTVVKSAGIFSETQANDLLVKLNNLVADGNMTGSIPFDLSDKIDSFPELKSPEHQRIIIERSIKNLQGSGFRPVAALMDYVQRVGKDSAEGKRVESLLPTMNIRRNELEAVAKLFPEFSAARKEEITAHVFVQFKNVDRLLSDDILQTLRNNVRGVEWVSSVGPKITSVVIERVRNDEKTLPERSQTITYAQHEVNLLGAVILMPRNASYLYEVISGGAEIEYGYVVSAVAEGKTIHDEVIRGKVGGEYRRCQNARIQNVFGGVTSAGFVANDDMQQRCNGPSSASMEDLRKQVFSKIVDGVLKIPTVKVAHDLNSTGDVTVVVGKIPQPTATEQTSAPPSQPPGYPSKNVALIVGRPGSASDVLARKLAPQLRDKVGRAVIVLNKFTDSAATVASVDPEGNVLLVLPALSLEQFENLTSLGRGVYASRAIRDDVARFLASEIAAMDLPPP